MNPDPDLTHSLRPHADCPDTRTFDPGLDAGLAAAFGADPTPGGWTQPPLLRDNQSDYAPVVHPSSPDMPHNSSRYQMLGEIARGGMGVILKGRDPDLGRDLAFKVLKAELTGRPTAEQRFVEEAQVGGQLQHPGIVPVYELGRFADGRPYFTMKLVEGRTLAAHLADRSSPDVDRGRFLTVFQQIAQTIAYAHSKGVIHRDLKPANIMVGDFGEVQVMDWGLAKVLHQGGIADEERASSTNRDPRPRSDDNNQRAIHTSRSGTGLGSDTVAGSVLGTPAYMSPEQAGGEIDKLDERADVFGLGAVLCVILTGQPPHAGNDAETVRLMATRGILDAAFARLDDCGADDELVSLCKRCLAPEREDRPRHAGEVAAAIAAYLQSVEDRAQHAEVERAEAEVRATEQRKHRLVHAAFGMTLTAVVGLVGFGLWWQERHAASIAAERVARQSRTAASVAAALDDARSRTEEAWGLADEPDKMRVATNLALAAVRRAEGFTVAGESTPEVDQELESVRASVTDLDRHTKLFVSADLALRAHDIGPNGQPDNARTAQRLAEAFRQFGWDPVQTPAETLAGEIASSRVRNKLLGFLCDWEFQSHGDRKTWLLVCDIIRNTRLRAGGVLAEWQTVMESRDPAALARFAARPDVLAMGPELLCALGRDLETAGGFEARAALLRRAVDRYPTHVWINFDLMRTCRQVYPRQHAEALRFASAAVAARPDSALLQVNLGESLTALSDHHHAISVFRKAISLAPTFTDPRLDLARALTRVGDLTGAVTAYRELIQIAANNPKMQATARAELGKVLYDLGDLDGAIAESLEAIRIYPNWELEFYKLPRTNLTMSYQKLGAYEEAAAVFRTLAKSVPSNAANYAKSAEQRRTLGGADKTAAGYQAGN